MVKVIKCLAVIVTFFCVWLTGCSAPKTIEAKEVRVSGSEDLRATGVVFDKGLRDYMALYQSKLLYMEMEPGTSKYHYFLYDLETSENKKLRTIRDTAVQYDKTVLVDDKLYFTVYRGNRRKVYVMDFSSDTLKKASSIPSDSALLTEFEEHLWVLRKRDSEDGIHYVERIGESDPAERLVLEYNIGSYPMGMDGTGENLCAVVREDTGNDERFYFVRYNNELKEDKKIDITHIFSENEVSESIVRFFALGTCFYMSDMSNNSIICKAENGDVSVVLCDKDILNVEINPGDTSHAYFRRIGTDDFYMLDTKIGEIRSFDIAFENESYSVRTALEYEESYIVIAETDDSK